MVKLSYQRNVPKSLEEWKKIHHWYKNNCEYLSEHLVEKFSVNCVNLAKHGIDKLTIVSLVQDDAAPPKKTLLTHKIVN